METMIKLLAAPFDARSISWRVGATTKNKDKAIPLAYLNSRDVMERLDDACGVAGWQCRYPFEGCCEISVLIDGHWITKTNGADQTNIEGVKGQYSGAFKRAAVLWGVGRYLYDVPNIWMPINEWKKFEKTTIAELNSKLTDWQTQYFAKKEHK